jgi:hypothetical protein
VALKLTVEPLETEALLGVTDTEMAGAVTLTVAL